MNEKPALAIDCEWGYHQGRLNCETAFQPVILCARKLSTGEEFSFGPGDRRLASFVAAHHDHVFVAHNVVSEMKYLSRAGVPLPPLWWDTLVGFKAVHNRPGFLSASLVTALTASGLSHLIPINKTAIRDKILALDFTPADLPEIIAYCTADAVAAGALYRHLVSEVNPVAMGYWCEFLKAVARMELRGVPIDLANLSRIWKNRFYIAESLRDEINRTAPIYRDGSFCKAAFFDWVKRQEIQWPTKVGQAGRYLPLDKDTLEAMESRHPFIRDVRQTRKALSSLNEHSIVVDGRSRRHYHSAMPFRTVTGRSQPSQCIFGGAKWLRWLVVPPDQHSVLVYVDYAAQEIGIAAALSGDEAMKAMYTSSDPHLRFAQMAGAVPAEATKDTHEAIRSQFKTVSLGVLYNQTEFGISERLGIDLDEAKALLRQHRRLFSTFHKWSSDVVSAAYQRGFLTTKAGWRANVEPDTKWRTWANFLVQASAADAMRLFTIALDRMGVDILAIIHDGWLLSCPSDQTQQLRRAIDLANRAVCEKLFNGFPLRLDVTEYRDRFRDAKGEKMWDRIQSGLPEERLYAPCE